MSTEIRPQTSVLPSGTPLSLFHTKIMTTLYPSQTPNVYPTPTSLSPDLSLQSRVLYTPTSSPTPSASQQMIVSSLPGSAPFPPPPIPPPFPTGTPIFNRTEDVASPNVSMTATPTVSMLVDFVTSTSYETVTVYVSTTSSVSFVPPTSLSIPNMTYRPMASQSFVMSTPGPTPSASFPPLSSSPLPTNLLPTRGQTPSLVSPTERNTTESITSPPALIPVKCIMILDGDCNYVKGKERLFKEVFAKFVSDILEMDIDRLSIQDVRCGSVVVDFTIQDTSEKNLAEDLTVKVHVSQMVFQFDSQNFTAESVAIINSPNPTKKPSKTEKSGLTFEEEQLLIYIVIGSAMGIVIMLSLILLIHHRIRKSCSTHAQSFDIQEEPHIKLSDFNMAHTYIPRPRSIYGSRLDTGAEGTYHGNNGSGNVHHAGLQRPTPYIHADDEAIKDHYHEVVDNREPVLQTARMSQDFGRSAVPEMNLPRLEGKNFSNYILTH